MLETMVFASFLQYAFGILLTLTAIFLILLVLVQRGRGGGLAGAFGGMGGQSAFGTKAGDMFTKVTIGASIFWIVLCIASIKFLGSKDAGAFDDGTMPTQQSAPDRSKPIDDGRSGSNTPPADSTAPADSAAPADSKATTPTPPAESN
ncbi:MAG: preprotein translocase subunit SecG [Pirellulaceae bacterium]|nr:preprotein translocase subunit SecG [Pirellulaceae bacterium]